MCAFVLKLYFRPTLYACTMPHPKVKQQKISWTKYWKSRKCSWMNGEWRLLLWPWMRLESQVRLEDSLSHGSKNWLCPTAMDIRWQWHITVAANLLTKIPPGIAQPCGRQLPSMRDNIYYNISRCFRAHYMAAQQNICTCTYSGDSDVALQDSICCSSHCFNQMDCTFPGLPTSSGIAPVSQNNCHARGKPTR